MGFIDLVRSRESCRSYADRPVPREALVSALEAARLAPSACNIQPWRYIAALDKETVARIAKSCQSMGMNRFTDTVPAFVVVCEEAGSVSETAASVLSGRRFAQIDIGISVAHLILAAKTLGLDTCVIGWFNEKTLRETLAIPAHHKVRLVVAVGYPAAPGAPPRVKRRRELDKIARFI